MSAAFRDKLRPVREIVLLCKVQRAKEFGENVENRLTPVSPDGIGGPTYATGFVSVLHRVFNNFGERG